MKANKSVCNICIFVCPWIPGKNETVSKCPLWVKKVEENRIIDMVKLTGRKIDKVKPIEDLDYFSGDFLKKVDFICNIHTNINYLFYISSKPGTGKTHILLAYCLELRLKKVNAYYTTSTRMRQVWLEEKDIFNLSPEESNFYNSEVLIIDDFGYEGYSESGHFQRKIEAILQSTDRKIILASNIGIDHEEFPYRNEPWIMDRLNSALKIGWKGESYRKPIKNNQEV